LADYMVIKKFGPGKSEWRLEEFSYRDGHEDSLLAEGRVPGQDFVKVTGEGTPEGARRQAEAYFSGTHEEPGVIDAWVQSVAGP
jgi:hypothetical protein